VLLCIDSADGGNDADRWSFAALSVTAAVIVVISIISLTAIFCVVARRHAVLPLKSVHPATGSTSADGRHVKMKSIQSALPMTVAARPASFYESVYSVNFCPTVKSSWTSTSLPLSELYSASQLAARHASMFPPAAARQLQPITLHYYNDF